MSSGSPTSSFSSTSCTYWPSTQMSASHLLTEPTVDGALQTALLLALVWWAWIYTNLGDELARTSPANTRTADADRADAGDVLACRRALSATLRLTRAGRGC